jgi:uncharacterized membrane protein YeaQ/YmgE (transglycosylase-associated protein family)
MTFLAFLIVLLLIGLVAGALGRLALPGPDPMSIPMTIAIGIGGSLIGGIIGRLLFGRSGGGFILSVAGAALIVYFVRRSRGGGVMDPGAPPRA